MHLRFTNIGRDRPEAGTKSLRIDARYRQARHSVLNPDERGRGSQSHVSPLDLNGCRPQISFPEIPVRGQHTWALSALAVFTECCGALRGGGDRDKDCPGQDFCSLSVDYEWQRSQRCAAARQV